MFRKLIALLLVLPVISALQLAQPTTTVRSASSITVTWTTSPGDPATFDLYLTNDNFHNTFALKNVVTTSDGTLTVTLPVVQPGPGYTFQASPVGDVTTKLSQTGTFQIDAALSSSSSSSSTTSGTGASSISGGPPSLSTSGLGSTISKTSTPAGSGSSTSTSPGTTSTGSFNGNGNSGALSVTGIGATVVGVLVAAGAFLGF